MTWWCVVMLHAISLISLGPRLLSLCYNFQPQTLLLRTETAALGPTHAVKRAMLPTVTIDEWHSGL